MIVDVIKWFDYNIQCNVIYVYADHTQLYVETDKEDSLMYMFNTIHYCFCLKLLIQVLQAAVLRRNLVW